MISRIHLKMAEVKGMVHMGGKRLLQGWWCPVCRKLAFDQMAAPVPDMMDTGFLYFSHCLVF
jgi:hypothetical protein